VAETIGQLMQFWGFKRPMGRIWTVLYLSPIPLGAADLGDRLKMSAGSVSMNLNELLKWGAIKRTWRPGERRDYYECETSIWKLVSRVLRERELALIREASSTLELALEHLPTSPAGIDADQLEFKRTRIETLRRLAKVGETLLASLDAGVPVSPDAIRAVADDVRES
jgi:DNA-binding transcriptional regulator GbsR (MarR family)